MNKLSNRIVLIITILTVLISFSIGFLIIHRSTQIVEMESKQKLVEMARRIGSEFDFEVREVEKVRQQVNELVESTFDLHALNTDPDYMIKYKEQIAPVIQRMAQDARISRSVYVFFAPEVTGGAHDVWYTDINNSGTVSRQEEFDISFYEEETPEKDWYFETKAQGRPYWTAPYQGNVYFDNHLTYISHTAPIYIDGVFIGVAGADYYFETLRDRIMDIRLYDTGYAVLFNGDMEALIHPTLEEGVSLREIDDGKYAELADAIETAEGVTEFTWIDGKVHLIASKKLLNDWIIAVVPYKEEVFKSVNQTRSLMYLIIGIGGMLAALIGIVTGKKVVQPIEQIVIDINKIGLGDYENEIAKKFRMRNDEVGILANSVESMRQTQKTSFEEINAVNAQLEKRVKERTQELIQTNEYLEESMAQLEEKQAEMILTNEALEDALEMTRVTQRQLIESEKIASLGYLVGGIAHEINTPVGNSVTLVTFIQKESGLVSNKVERGKITKKELSEYIRNVLEASETIYRNLKTTGDLVSRFKQIAASESKESIIHFNVGDYLQLIVKSMGLLGEHAGIHVEILGDPNVEVFSDAGKFSQIFTNLISNSLMHGFENHDVGTIQIQYETVSDGLFIKYEDNGAGIEQAHLDSIYTPFFTTKFSGETKGLGLNIVYNVVTKLFGGTIKCESELGKGTLFFINLKMKVSDKKTQV